MYTLSAPGADELYYDDSGDKEESSDPPEWFELFSTQDTLSRMLGRRRDLKVVSDLNAMTIRIPRLKIKKFKLLSKSHRDAAKRFTDSQQFNHSVLSRGAWHTGGRSHQSDRPSKPQCRGLFLNSTSTPRPPRTDEAHVKANRVQWTKEEDQLLQRLASQPPTNWRLVTESLNNTPQVHYRLRSVKDCKQRHHTLEQAKNNGTPVIYQAPEAEKKTFSSRKKQKDGQVAKASAPKSESHVPVELGCDRILHTIEQGTKVIHTRNTETRKSMRLTAPSTDSAAVPPSVHKSHKEVINEAHRKLGLHLSPQGKPPSLMPPKLIELKQQADIINQRYDQQGYNAGQRHAAYNQQGHYQNQNYNGRQASQSQHNMHYSQQQQYGQVQNSSNGQYQQIHHNNVVYGQQHYQQSGQQANQYHANQAAVHHQQQYYGQQGQQLQGNTQQNIQYQANAQSLSQQQAAAAAAAQQQAAAQAQAQQQQQQQNNNQSNEINDHYMGQFLEMVLKKEPMLKDQVVRILQKSEWSRNQHVKAISDLFQEATNRREREARAQMAQVDDMHQESFQETDLQESELQEAHELALAQAQAQAHAVALAQEEERKRELLRQQAAIAQATQVQGQTQQQQLAIALALQQIQGTIQNAQQNGLGTFQQDLDET
jgi:hypothetical protein